MALGHTRQKHKKTPKTDKVNQTASTSIVSETLTDAPATIELDLKPSNETNPERCASPVRTATSQPNDDAQGLGVAQKDQSKSKAARKRAAIKKKKQGTQASIEPAVQDNSSNNVTTPLSQSSISAKDEAASSQLPHTEQSRDVLPTNEPADPVSTAKQQAKKKRTKSKSKSYTKEEKAQHTLKLQHEADPVINQESVELPPSQNAQTPVIITARSPGVETVSKAAKKKHNQRKKSPGADEVEQSPSNTVEVTKSGSAKGSTTPSTTKDDKTAQRSLEITNPPPPSQIHSRQKSIDVRLHLNGKQHKSIPLDVSHRMPASPTKESEGPVKIKLPGRDVTLVCREDARRPHAKHLKHRSQATSVSSQASIQSKVSLGMRSRQSSHTTVGTSGALESKLQNMILSHASDSPAMTTSTSAISHPTDSARSSSPLAVKAPSMSAPPESISTSGRQSPRFVRVIEGLPQAVTTKPEPSSYIGQTPAVPTVFDTRSSQLHAPPSLGPPQPQNLPEQIPPPYQYHTMPYQNNGMTYGHQYPLQSPSYYNYYPIMPPQNYASYNNMSMGMQMPMYDQPINGTVYYNSDGTPIYPQEYYSGPYMMPDMYQHQFNS